MSEWESRENLAPAIRYNVSGRMQFLTERQAAFVDAMRRVGDPTKAAELAGYRSPYSAGKANLEAPHVGAVLRAQVVQQLEEAAPLAVATLMRVMVDARAPASARVAAAAQVLDRAGYTRAADAPEMRPVHEMTPSELDATISALEKTIAERNRMRAVIDVASESHPGGVFD